MFYLHLDVVEELYQAARAMGPGEVPLTQAALAARLADSPVIYDYRVAGLFDDHLIVRDPEGRYCATEYIVHGDAIEYPAVKRTDGDLFVLFEPVVLRTNTVMYFEHEGAFA